MLFSLDAAWLLFADLKILLYLCEFLRIHTSRMYTFDNPERQRKSCSGLQKTFLRKPQERNEVADFFDRGLVGGSLQRIWTDLADTCS